MGLFSTFTSPTTWENDQSFDPSDIYQDVLTRYASNPKYDITTEEMQEMIDRIAYHESKGIPSAKQLGGGPGRGLFQFEIGKQRGAQTAIQRFRNYYEKHDPKLANIVIPEDFSTISGDMQKAIFLINLMATPNRPGHTVEASLDSVKQHGMQSLEDLWINYHWKGYEVDPGSIEARRASFQRDMQDYDKKYKK